MLPFPRLLCAFCVAPDRELQRMEPLANCD